MNDSLSTHDLVLGSLKEAYSLAEEARAAGADREYFNVKDDLAEHIEIMCEMGQKASSGFTNIITGLAIKMAYPEMDTRYHQVQIQEPKAFNFRGVSEKTVYPWLRDNDFDGAKSGWQTRTFERPKPYTLGTSAKAAS